ncbi:C6 transcription factor [Penicillium hetheringtonii]|uniref:C6 transcription factor n=1 Tax=Penicillium hetheringtonii TaxID=911720 RepID=A0AAD6E626_9EURO|nr:C6 transcription factor [Penicillium hetheringtonii]
MSEYRFRPIRPRTPNSIVSAVEETDNNTLNEILIKRRSVACTECQRRRTKCAFGNPCLECKKHNSLCLFEENSDKRRKTYSKKIEEELKFYRGFLDDLIETIRQSNNDDIDRIVNIVRSESLSLSEIQLMIKGIPLESEYSRTTI